jgi:AcrR family transcriptional regulator
MTSLRHKPDDQVRSPADLALDAARDAILAVGWSRTTLTDIARRAGVSRMTLYRNWPDMGSLLGDLMTREWTGLVATEPSGKTQLERLARGVVETVRAVRGNPLFSRIIELDPELLLPYLLQRPGRAQDLVIGVLTEQIRAAQKAGEVRRGDPAVLARGIVLAAHGFTLSAHTMTGAGVRESKLDDELAVLVESYLRP